MNHKYINPRIDLPMQQGNAELGQVRLDRVKLIWLVSMAMFGTIGSALTASPGSIALFVIFTAFTLCFGHSLGMHRCFIHRSYQSPRWLEIFLVHLGTLVGLAGPIGMLKTHDLRDWAQRQQNCHSYFSHGEKWYQDAYWQLICSIKLQQPPLFEIEPSIATDPIIKGMERTWMLQQLPWAILFFSLGGWGWVFWGICSRVMVSILGHWIIGYFAHNQGHTSWHISGAAVQGHNIAWTSLLTMGECWHNNHHAFPGSAKFGLEAGQWDPGWWVLLALQRIGLVYNLKTPDQIRPRADLIKVEV